MSETDKTIGDILAKYGEPLAGNVWRVQGRAVIYHKALERIAGQAGITWDTPTIVRAERDEAVILVTGRMKGPRIEGTASQAGGYGPERIEWSIGEALIGVNYRVSGKQAAYVYAMAEKRAKDRVILKLIELSGLVYSDEEADEFREGRPAEREAAPDTSTTEGRVEAANRPPETRVELVEAEAEIEAGLKKKIDKAKSINAVTDLMLHEETQRALNALSPEIRDEVRDYAKAKLMALGWPGKKQS